MAEDLAVLELSINLFVGVITVVALWVAVRQAIHARKDATDARRAMARERRLSFELQILADIYDQWHVTGPQHVSGHISALVRDATDPTDIPLLRVATGTKSPYSDNSLLTRFPRETPVFRAQVLRELDDAIERRLKEEK
ncbi:hypothetical protein [Microbacterium sp. WCS2018Hpa-9]|uniref:hypothetical protein n=1 Tax=Microbacterium sp. WCS2018Hpa-9 TaxID=3073635 RepID=UPI002889B403|nr:hypothetical protein [Microbacterium sp. WCS2018Hpa-9]